MLTKSYLTRIAIRNRPHPDAAILQHICEAPSRGGYVPLPSSWNVNTSIYLDVTDVGCIERYEKERIGPPLQRNAIGFSEISTAIENLSTAVENSLRHPQCQQGFPQKEDYIKMSELAESLLAAKAADRLLPDDSGRAAAPSRHIANGKKSKAPRAAQRPARRTDVA